MTTPVIKYLCTTITIHHWSQSLKNSISPKLVYPNSFHAKNHKMIFAGLYSPPRINFASYSSPTTIRTIQIIPPLMILSILIFFFQAKIHQVTISQAENLKLFQKLIRGKPARILLLLQEKSIACSQMFSHFHHHIV